MCVGEETMKDLRLMRDWIDIVERVGGVDGVRTRAREVVCRGYYYAPVKTRNEDE
jgi:hypothetical protein